MLNTKKLIGKVRRRGAENCQNELLYIDHSSSLAIRQVYDARSRKGPKLAVMVKFWAMLGSATHLLCKEW